MKLKRTILGPILVAFFAFVSGGWLLQRGADGLRDAPDERVLIEILQRLSRDYVDEHQPDDLYRMAVEGLLQELGDPNTSLLTPRDYNELRISTTGNYGGLGIQIAERNGWITILAPLPDTPAERAGLRSGDRIVEVEGESTEGWSEDDALQALRGPRGAPVSIGIARPGVDQPIAFDLVRDEIHFSSVPSAYMVDPEIGYAQLRVFSETSTDELSEAVTTLQDQGMRAMILDLRQNPGGLLDQGVSVSDLFVDAGAPIVETRARNPRDNVMFSASRSEVIDGMPIVVLVDQYSASAAEIVAGALQDHDRALVIGAPTFGKGSVQTLFPLSGGNFLKMTTGKWYTPSGRSIERDRSATDDEVVAMLGTDPVAADGFPVPDDAGVDTVGLDVYRTDSGREVYGGGGIVPDLIVRQDTLNDVEREFFEVASESGNTYLDVILEFAVRYVAENPDIEQDFVVTEAIEREVYEALRVAGLEVTWEQFEGARNMVDMHVGREIARAKWGQEAYVQWENRDDPVIRTAIDLLRQAPDQQALFSMAAMRADAR